MAADFSTTSTGRPTKKCSFELLMIFLVMLAQTVHGHATLTANICEPIRLPMCQNQNLYNTTRMPNIINQFHQEDAALTLQTFAPLIAYGCHPYLQNFLCSVFIPPCDDTTFPSRRIDPCYETCVSVRDACSPILQSFGFSWPSSLECHNFPATASTCLDVIPSAAETGPHCHELTTELDNTLCSDMPYNSINETDHNVQASLMEIHQWYPLVRVRCSPHLARFICLVYFPQCDQHVSYPIGPCADLCEAARHGCESLMNKFGFPWPESVRCSQFPHPGQRQCHGLS